MGNFISAQRWIGVRIELLGACLVFVACTAIVTFNDSLGIAPGIAALLIIWSSNFTITLGFLLDSLSEAEAAITSIERVNAMTLLPQEAAMETDEKLKRPAAWPSEGMLQLED